MEKRKLEKYFNNTASPSEREEIGEWITDKRNKQEVLEAIEAFWEDFEPDNTGADDVPAFEKMLEKLKKDNDVQRLHIRRRSYTTWIYIAGAACVLLIGTLFYFLYTLNSDSKRDSYVTVRTEKGQRKRFMLGDGSEVYLNADSKISYPSNLKSKQSVYVEGEAFIKMAKDRDSMVIESDGIETTVKGKAFNISAFPKDSTIKVSVDQGNAEIRRTEKTWPLTKLRIPANQEALAKNKDSVSKSSFFELRKPGTFALVKLRPSVVINNDAYAVISKQQQFVDLLPTANERKAFGWKDGIIYFENASLNEIISKLERWYGVEITFCEGTSVISGYTAEFQNISLNEVLKKISTSLNISFQIKGKNIYFCNEKTYNKDEVNPLVIPPD